MSSKFIIFVIDDRWISATDDEMVAIDIFNDELQRNGNWVFGTGLASPNDSTVIDNRNNLNQETGRSLFEGQEHYSGFWLIQADDLNHARKLAFAGSKACNRKVELRPLLE